MDILKGGNMSIQKIKLCTTLYVKGEDDTTGSWNSFDLLNPADIAKLELFIEVVKNEPENLGEYNLFKKVIEFKKEKK
jgi:hypothetical protein